MLEDWPRRTAHRGTAQGGTPKKDQTVSKRRSLMCGDQNKIDMVGTLVPLGTLEGRGGDIGGAGGGLEPR